MDLIKIGRFISDCRKKISNVLLFSIEFIYGVLGVVIVMRL